jgi:murein DD-endopeptidase MepM/ murein hydrolase activator NlpD
MLASTPSIWPTQGWVTSDFGVRLDPYSADRSMHQGLDISTPHGQPVQTPSDGTVVFNGTEGGYGKVLVIDHGYGVKTRYGHLSETFVRLGERVSRGQKVAAVGNTGRSTGPHLHYEVRVNGIPENPRKFILE